MNSIVSFAYNNPVVLFVLALGLLFFVVRKPKLFFGLLFLGLFLAGLFYLIMSTAGSGSQHKKRLIDEDKRVDVGG
ncbi:MAG TPA: hypothetical protein VLZ10_15225 [Thermodesulfobacteriota bacterium]|nr:hypothetical protein [Thermodesulfobacteriota bacterium]